ncbi:aldolase/citrate lyase family protein [Streptomyces boncukensis]|uniref:CoA ester lyase n=1 Tax=Streptomyces boncukensis TaxID=2711219 RepID=A0A6G4WQW8_9ACTN|nr:aldolase/citrate lyase family protein [Streptomyces boncukensis]NGO67413.1 CoA ester lyase [Streptomyces boncukensis]
MKADSGDLAGTRSWLFTPGTEPRLFPRAAEAGADVQIIDLEDAVPPAAKDRARVAALNHLAAQPGVAAPPGPVQALRINSPATPAGVGDLRALLSSTADPDLLVVPKSETSAVLDLLDGLLHGAGKRTRLVALAESARAAARPHEVFRTRRPLAAVLFGAADTAADLGAEPGWEPLRHARQVLLAAAAAAGVPAVDSPFFALGDPEGLRAEASLARSYGFAAKAAIHPSHVAVLNDVFTPTAAQGDWARRVLAAGEGGAGTVDGAMVDEAVARRARRILAGLPDASSYAASR